MKSKKALGNALLILTAMIWGTAFVAQRTGMETIEPMTFNAARMALAAIVIGALALILDKSKKAGAALAPNGKQSPKQNIAGGICCGVFLAAASLFQQMGLVYTTAGKAGFITAMYMLFVPVISFVVFRRKTPKIVWLAVLLGIAGMYLLCVSEGFSITWGDSLVAVCALLFSGHILCCDYFVQRGNPIKISAIQFLTAAIISAVAAFITETPTWDKVLSAAVPIAYCGIVSGGIGYTLQITAQRFTAPAVASLLMSLESVFAVIAGALLLGERMSPRELAGCVIMFAAITLVQIPLPKRKNKTK